ncbi:DUF1684 domain-containing protein [Aequorivita marina]|uniref:DUF1684 domain-containing protein n=1 Tax=Aequorivita marina TaxID=3073654 RepID=UPI0028742099|nr:DUF1684 domain-containing protein [Aequorivita sp. S2608]MDS1299296.1 DUF1684 domain-containing protein [Aequorivita sp. S2608]
MKQLFLLLFLLLNTLLFAQNVDLIAENQAAQEKLNEEYTNAETSILEPQDFKVFEGLEFYPIDLKYRVEARFVRTPNEKPFLMPTSTDRLPEYVKYGEAHFTLEGKNFVVSLFKSTQPYDEPGYEDYLFFPFTDLTSGDGSYGGGRYLDQRIPEGDTIIIDFNKAYNPYCAYSARYSCPIPPKENDILVRIEAGVKAYQMP